MTAGKYSDLDWHGPIDGAPNFTLAELCRSQVARRRGIDNRPGPEARDRLSTLARTVLQPLRDRFGPIVVTSGYRCKELNRLVGGSPRSHHLLGHAADIRPMDEDAELLKMLCCVHDHMPFDELVAEYFPRGWVHVAYSGASNPARRLLIAETGKPIIAASIEQICSRYAHAA